MPPAGRVVTPILVVGGLLTLLLLRIPGYVQPNPWARAEITGLGVLCLVGAVLSHRYGVSARVMMGLALLADVATVISVFTLPGNISGRTSSTLFSLPAVMVALYCTRRMLAVQAVAAALCTGTMVALTVDVSASSLMQVVCIWLATTAPALAIWQLRTRLEASVEQERHRSVTDPLTMIGNRRAVDVHADDLVTRSGADGVVLGVAVVDVDHFKRVNDRFGHRVGDQVIQEVSRALTETVRSDDLVVRLGGEEFAVFAVLPMDDLAALGERIRTTVAERCAERRVTVSVGVTWRDPLAVTVGDPAEALWQLVEEADNLMYAAKRAGRNRVRTSVDRLAQSPLPA